MAKYARGKKSQAISDRGGLKVPYTELRTTWDGLRVEIVDVNYDAWALVTAQNQFNDPPLAGKSMLMVTVPIFVPLETGLQRFSVIPAGSRRASILTNGETGFSPARERPKKDSDL